MDGGAGKGDIASFATDVAGGKGDGVWASLATHRARGDGHDRLFRFESLEGSAFHDILIGNRQGNAIDGGPGDDHLIGGGGPDISTAARAATAATAPRAARVSCGRERTPKASAYVQLDPTSGGGGGLEIVGGGGHDDFTVAFDEATETFGVTADKGIAIGPGCTRRRSVANQVTCAADGPARWLMADLGPGNDSLRVEGSLLAVGNVRLAGGLGNDTIHGGPEDDLIEAGPGADQLYGGAGADGLVGGLPGPTYLYGGPNGDLLAAGGGCAGGALVGGPGRDDASFAETQAHPGLLDHLLPRARRLDRHDQGLPQGPPLAHRRGHGGLLRQRRPDRRRPRQRMLGQPGEDEFFGNGGEDVIDARDGVRDYSIQCGRASRRRTGQAGARHLDRPRPHRPLRPGPGQLRGDQTRPPGPRPRRLIGGESPPSPGREISLELGLSGGTEDRDWR